MLEFEDLRDVILVGHSYGGMVITGAADRVPDRIGRLVFLDAANPVNGQSLADVAGPVINAVRPFGETVDGLELVLLPAPDAGLLYGVTDPDDLAWMAERLTPTPGSASSSRWTSPTRRRCGPSRSTTSSAPRPWPPGTRPHGGGPAEGRLWDIDTGHDLMITEPEKVTRRVSPGRRGLTDTRSLQGVYAYAPDLASGGTSWGGNSMGKASGRHKGRLGLAALAFTAGVGITEPGRWAGRRRSVRLARSPSS